MVGTVTVTACPDRHPPTPPPPTGGGGPQPGTPGKDTTAPVISRFGMTNARFRVRRGAHRA